MFYRYSDTKVGNFFLKNRTFNALYRLQWTRPGGHGSGVKIGLIERIKGFISQVRKLNVVAQNKSDKLRKS